MIDPEIPAYIPAFEEVAQAYGSFEEHNRRHSGFGTLFDPLLEAAIEKLDVIGEDTTAVLAEEIYAHVKKRLEEAVVEGDMHAEIQDMVHGDVLMRIGVKFLPIGGHISSEEGRRLSSDRLLPLIVNTELFSEFLSIVSKEEAQTEDGSKLLVDAAVNLDWVITTCLSKDAGQDITDEEHQIRSETGRAALRTWLAVESDYKRLGFDAEALRAELAGISPELRDYLDRREGGFVPSEINKEYKMHQDTHRKLRIFGPLEQYATYWGENLLPEFIFADRNGYVTPPEEENGFGPSRWANDMSPDKLTEHWEKAIVFLEDLETKDKNGRLSAEVRRCLEASLNASIFDMAVSEEHSKDAYERALAEWKAHGEQPYQIPYGDMGGYTPVSHAPEKEDFDFSTAYYTNNRLALETAALRFVGH